MKCEQKLYHTHYCMSDSTIFLLIKTSYINGIEFNVKCFCENHYKVFVYDIINFKQNTILSEIPYRKYLQYSLMK